MRSTDEPSNEEPRRRKTLEAAGLRLTPEQLESVRVDIEAVRRNIGRLEALDLAPEDPAITFAVLSGC